MVRIITSSFIVALSLAVAAPALSASLDPHERDAMLSACGNLSGGDRSLCVEVVNDDSIVANTKRSCLQAMRHMVRGSAWDTVRGTPYAMTCRDGLRRAGYPVNSVMRRLAGAQ